MGTGTHGLEEANQVSHIFIQAKPSMFDFDVTRVVPISDIDVVVAQQGFDRATQQGGEMTRHRRYQQDPRLWLNGLLTKTQQAAKRRFIHHLFMHRNGASGLSQLDTFDAERWSQVR